MFKFLDQHLQKQKERKVFEESIQNLLDEGSLSLRFVLLTCLSAAIATLGIAMNNSSILIGSMLIAPLLVPMIGLSIGMGSGSWRLILNALASLTAGVLLSILVAYVVARGILPIHLDDTLYAQFSDSFLYFLVALFAGILAVYSWFSPKTHLIIAGVGVAVALMPPLAFLGVVLATREVSFLTDILQLILVNLLGIMGGGLLTFIVHTLFSRHSSNERSQQVEMQMDKRKIKSKN